MAIGVPPVGALYQLITFIGGVTLIKKEAGLSTPGTHSLSFSVAFKSVLPESYKTEPPAPRQLAPPPLSVTVITTLSKSPTSKPTQSPTMTCHPLSNISQPANAAQFIGTP